MFTVCDGVAVLNLLCDAVYVAVRLVVGRPECVKDCDPVPVEVTTEVELRDSEGVCVYVDATDSVAVPMVGDIDIDAV